MSSKIPIIFETFDPIDRAVFLSENAWDKCKSLHKEIKNSNEIQTTIESPQYIAKDKNKDTTHNYYKENNEISSEHEKYTKVCVSFEDYPKKGKIATAYKCNKVHHQDTIIWTR